MTAREAQLEKQLAECQEALAVALRENQLLRQKVDLLVKRIFGSSSEKLDSAQLELLQLSEHAAAPQPPPTPQVKTERAPRVRQPKAPRLPDNLPVVEEVIDPEPVKAQPENWRQIGQEVTEQLDYEPGRFLKRRTVRRTYVHRTEQDSAPVTAPLPPCLQERGLAAPGLLAHVLVSKYCDHLPLYRQEQIFVQRHGVNLPRQTLARWVELAADWLTPIYDQIRTGVLAGGYVQIDETPIEYLEPGFGKTKQGYLWTLCRPREDVFYWWNTSRAAACLDEFVPKDFKGTVQCDGYAAYPCFANGRHGAIILAGCWAHARRAFYEARAESPKISGWFLRQIQNLYRVESVLREKKAGPALREAVRAHQSRPIVERIGRALSRFKTKARFLPKSLLGQAIDFALGQWSALQVYLGDGRVEIDNNLVENAIRPTALGKKNWLFVGEAGAGQRGAIIYTLIECCRRRGLDPYTYLRDVLTRLPYMTNRQIPEVMPQAWAKARRRLQRAA
ncbi:MAG TPA: IS66 family transposase [Verrucomicrobiae bacterium]